MIKTVKLLNYIGISILFFVFALSAPAQENRLQNADFENNNIDGWFTWAVTTDTSKRANHTPGGEFSANPSLNVEDGPFEAGALIQEFVDFKPGDTLYASAWVKTDNLKSSSHTNVYALIKIEFWDGSNLIKAKESQKVTGTSDWKQVGVTATVPVQTTMVKYLLMLYNEGDVGNIGQAYFDDTYLGTAPLPY